MDTIIQIVANNESFKVPSSKAVYDELENIRNNFRYFIYEFEIPDTDWLVIHNKNTINFQESVIDSNGNKIYANVHIIDTNSFNIHFTQPASGFVPVRF